VGDVRVTATGELKVRLHDGATVAAGQSVRQATESLELDTTSGLILIPVVNGRAVAWDRILEPGDELTLVPVIAGG